MLERPLWVRWARVFVVGGCIIGTGVLLFKYTTPTDEELIARFSPEVRANYEKNKALRQKEQQELMLIAQETAKSNDPIWKAGRIKSPFEKEGRGVDPRLVDAVAFHKKEAQEFQKQKVERAGDELEEAQKLLSEKKRSWWGWK